MKQFDTSVDNMLFFNTKKQRKIIPVDTAPVVIHFNPIYEQFDNHQRVHNQIVRDANCVRIRVKTWPEFINAIREEQPDFLTIHQSVIDIEHHTLEEFSTTIQSLVKYLPKHCRHNEILPVAIGIDTTTTQKFVRQLKKLGFAGIWPTATAFGAKICVEAMQEFMSNQEFWPESLINQLPNEPTQPLHIYFRSDAYTFVPAEIKKKTAAAMPFIERIYCETWADINKAIEHGASQMVIDYNILKHLNLGIGQILGMIDTKAKLYNTTMAVMVGIGPETPQSLVSELKKTSVLGVSPSAVHWGVDETAQAARALTNRQPHWPEHIINQLPNPKKLPNIVYYNDDHSRTMECTSEIVQVIKATYTIPGTWQELIREIESGEDKIVFHIDMISRVGSSIGEFIDSINTITRFMSTHNTLKILVLIKPTTPQNQIRELKNAKILGIGFDMNYYSVEQAAEASAALIAGEPYWPKHIIDQLPGNKPIVKSTTGIKLTVRQQEVMDLICNRGLSNKQIAKTLNLSESTVKIHVSAVMRSYGVRNRTQLALSAGTGLKA